MACRSTPFATCASHEGAPFGERGFTAEYATARQKSQTDSEVSSPMLNRDPLERQPLVPHDAPSGTHSGAADEEEAMLGAAARNKLAEELGGSLFIARALQLAGLQPEVLPVPPRLWYVLELILVTAVYMMVGPALILVNKHIMKDLGFAYPIAVAAMGQLSSWAFCVLCFRVLRTHELQMCEQVTWRFYVTNMGVVGAASAGALAFGQGVYLYMSVSFIQILKSLSPVITSCFLVAFGIERPSCTVWACVLMISAGAALASYGELHFSAIGTALMLTASCCEGLRLVLTQKVVVNLRFPALEGLYYNAPITAAWMLLAALFLELPAMLAAERRGRAAAAPLDDAPTSAAGAPGRAPGAPSAAARALAELGAAVAANATGAAPAHDAAHAISDAISSVPSWIIAAHWKEFALAATLGVLVNVSSMMMIKYTGSVTLKLLATARNAGLVLYAVVFVGEPTTITQVVGYAIACAFFVLYVYAKTQQGSPTVLSRSTSIA